MNCGAQVTRRLIRMGVSVLLLTRVLFLAEPAAAAMSPAEMRDVLSEADRLFEQANDRARKDPDGAKELYDGAIMRYERIVRDGAIENGKLYYNIGNAYFRKKDIGRAILNYRRAEQYMPNDANLQQNLQFARSRRADKVGETQKRRVLKTLFFWHYDLSSKVRSILFAIGFSGVWIFAALRLLVRRGIFTWLVVVNACIAVLFFGSLGVDAWNAHRVRPGVILAEEVVARKGDSASYEPSFKAPLHSGTEFLLIEDRGDWCEIELLDSRRCWVPASAVECVRPFHH